jgi:hypothetical protein
VAAPRIRIGATIRLRKLKPGVLSKDTMWWPLW